MWLEIVKEISDFVCSPSSQLDATDRSIVAQLTSGTIEASTASSLKARCSEIQKEIEEGIHEWSMEGNCTWIPKVNLPASLDRTVAALRSLCPHLHQAQPSLYLLFDESSPIPEPCQRVINGLLHRGRPYCVKLAVRPYEWSTLTTAVNRTIELDTDLKPLHMHYPNELEGNYIASMRAVANRILQTRITSSDSNRDGWPPGQPLDIQSILVDGTIPCSGFASVCATSSGNPQNLLSLCACIFATAAEALSTLPTVTTGLIHVPPQVQHDAIVRWSKGYEEQNPYTESRTFCQSLLRRVRQQNAAERSIGFLYSHDEPDLFSTDYLPRKVGQLIAGAFSGGFIRNTHTRAPSLFDVPSAFHLNRGLLPREGLDLRLPTEPASPLTSEFISKNSRDRVHVPSKGDKGKLGRPLRAFLSTSFASCMRQQRIDIKRALSVEEMQCVDVEDVCGDQFLFTSIQRTINNNDVTVFDATILRPYTLLEIGLCAAAPKPTSVICIVNAEGSDHALDQLPSYVKKLPIITFASNPDSLSRLAAAIRTRSIELSGKRSEFQAVAITETPLRRRRRHRTVFVSLPHRPKREMAIHRIKARLKEIDWTVVVEEDMAAYGANEFQVPIQCAYTCRAGIIDTTGEKAPDLLQCYKLGLFVGRRAPWRVEQVEQEAHANPKTFASVPSLSHSSWSTVDDLVGLVEEFVRKIEE